MPLKPGEDGLRSGGNWLTGDAYYQLTNGYRTSFFRLQVQPVYGVPWEQEDFRRFLETGERTVDPGDPMFAKIEDRRRTGRIGRRVYAIRPPLTDYQRYVFVAYHAFAEAGEDLRIIDLARTPDPGLPGFDFILLDDETVLKLHYEPDGRYLGRELLPEADLAEFRRYKELAGAYSMPFLEYEESGIG
ncbi:DUF6879 family protein [Amycolatopsis samaneae]|uniref:DUF6879 family protein n=1 Tax=Amycolatopsis samaneae TaxID=664691 RepID=A0ABW5GQ21_9PSEU